MMLHSKKEVRLKVTLLTDEDFKTKPQLGYYYGVIVPAAAMGYRAAGYAGTNDEKADFLLRREFYNETIFDTSGESITYPCSLSDISKEDMSTFIDNCIAFCAMELDIVVPAPPEK